MEQSHIIVSGNKNDQGGFEMRKVTKKEAEKVRGKGTEYHYKCPYCSYKSNSFVSFKNHLWAWHQKKYEDL